MQANNPSDIAANVAAIPIATYAVAALGAAVDLAESPIGCVGAGGPAAIAIGSVLINPGNNTLTASDTLFRTITITKRTAGGATVTVASGTTKTSGSGGTGNWVAWTPVVIPVSAGASISPGDSLSIAITHASTGTAVSACILQIYPSYT